MLHRMIHGLLSHCPWNGYWCYWNCHCHAICLLSSPAFLQAIIMDVIFDKTVGQDTYLYKVVI